MKKKVVIVSLVLYAALFSGCHEHSWIDATCTEPRTCSECSETEGEALGHVWNEATCTEPETCSRCGTTKGKALGHEYGEWITIREATLSEEGEKSRICSLCGFEEIVSIPVISNAEAEEVLLSAEEYMKNGNLIDAKTALDRIKENEKAAEYLSIINSVIEQNWTGIYQRVDDSTEYLMILCCIDIETINPKYVVCFQDSISEDIYYDIVPNPNNDSFVYIDEINNTVQCKTETNLITKAKYEFQPDTSVYHTKNRVGTGSFYSIQKYACFSKTDSGLAMYQHTIGTPRSSRLESFDKEFTYDFTKLDVSLNSVMLGDETYNMDNTEKDLTNEQIYDLAIEGYHELLDGMKNPNSLDILGVKYNSERRMVIFKYSGTNSFGGVVTEYAAWSTYMDTDYAKIYYDSSRAKTLEWDKIKKYGNL